MKTWLISLVASLLFFSCKKAFTGVEVPDLEISIESTTVGVNEPVVFNLTGNADVVTFFSGAPGSEYLYKNRTTLDNATPQLSFDSWRRYGAQDGLPDNTIALMVSQDFNGTYDAASINKATWVDLTDSAAWSYVKAPSTETTPSGNIDLSRFKEVDAPIYIGFKYNDLPKAVSQRAWTITNVQVNNVLEDGTVLNLANSADMSWSIINILNATRIWTFNATQIQIWGGAAQTDENLDWIIGKPIFLKRIGSDKGVSIKNNPSVRLTDYTFAGYDKPGTYKVTFEIVNANKWDTQKIVKEYVITVE
ncbi:DUF5017 domain-containing protein [Niabella aurantiaca]|uniref:DUF5017 domain-containing protein n=1 Tax=Niabella aurantiaca TaxID=379900 RepID=UPI0003730349|nr:DUF5017 domain-containing protein [Niabella aurantiaca]